MASKLEILVGRRFPLLVCELLLIAFLGYFGANAGTPEMGGILLTAMGTVIGIFGLTAKDYFNDISDEKVVAGKT